MVEIIVLLEHINCMKVEGRQETHTWPWCSARSANFSVLFQLILRIPRSPNASLQLVREGHPPKDDWHRSHGLPQGGQTQVQERLQGGYRCRFTKEEGLSYKLEEENLKTVTLTYIFPIFWCFWIFLWNKKKTCEIFGRLTKGLFKNWN